MSDQLYKEKLRPQFHFTARENWLNDPNGLVYYNGQYHLFFQHRGLKPGYDQMSWGHAISPDLLHWKQLPVAIDATDMVSVWSGSAVVDWKNTSGLQSGDEKVIACFYTNAHGISPKAADEPFTQCMAYSVDGGYTFTKYEHNPVLPCIIGENRDPKVFWFEPDEKWVMGLFIDGHDFALFSSKNLTQWDRLSDINMPGCSECPDMFEMAVDGDPANRKWVFVGGNGFYSIGTFDGVEFVAQEGPYQADFGDNYYATQSWNDIPAEDGRRIQIAWMAHGKYPEMPFDQQMNFPTELTLHTTPDGLRLRRVPVREIEKLRGKSVSWSDRVLGPVETHIEGISGDLFDIEAEIAMDNAEGFGIKVSGETINYSAKDSKLSSLGKEADLHTQDGKVKLRILVDRTTIELYANDGQVVMSSCFMPDELDGKVTIFATGGKARIISLKAYELNSAWPKD